MKYYNFGWCPSCGTNLMASWFIEREYNSHGYETGRVRQAANYLYCPNCGYIECVDDHFDGEWHY